MSWKYLISSSVWHYLVTGPEWAMSVTSSAWKFLISGADWAYAASSSNTWKFLAGLESTDNWILSTGYWDDDGIWVDGALWDEP